MAQGEKRPVVMEAAKGVPGGVASLGADGKVPQEQLPEFGISNAEIKQKLVDDDCLAITDSEANNRTKRVFWSNIKEILGKLFVPVTRKINNKALSSDVTLDAEDVGAATVSQINSAVSNYLPLSGGTMSGTAQIRHVADAGQWYQGRDRALIRTTFAIQNQYVPIISVKSSEGSWEIGTYQNDRLYFTYITDEAYESNDNTTNQGNEGGSRNVYLDVNGNFSGKAAGLTNTLPVANGGTGKTSWTANRLIYPSGSTTLSQLAFPSSSGSVLRQGTSGAPYWSSIADLVTAMGAVRIKCGTYTGNGAYDSESSYTSNPQTINVGLKPKAVLVMSETGGMDSGSGWYYGGLVWDGSDLVVFLDTNYGDINAKVITLTNSGFTVYAQRVQMSSSSYRYIATNKDGLKYRYIVFY